MKTFLGIPFYRDGVLAFDWLTIISLTTFFVFFWVVK